MKARPGQIDYASSGNGSGQHLFMALLASMTGMKLTHVPYRGSGQATTDLLGGQVPVSIPGTAGMVGHIKAGKLRALAVTGAKRVAAVARRADGRRSRACRATKRTSGWACWRRRARRAPIVDKLHRDVVAGARDDEVKTYMAHRRHRDRSARRRPSSARSSAPKRDQWAKVVRETGAKID